MSVANFLISSWASSSVSRPRISKSLPLNLSCKATKAGISPRHGPHHVAQRFRRSTFPFLSATLKVVPSRFLRSDCATEIGSAGYSDDLLVLGASAVFPSSTVAFREHPDQLEAAKHK